MYKLIKDQITGSIGTIFRSEDGAYIPIAADNSDYQTFKAQINTDEAQLEDADGVIMSPEEAKAFVATLP